VNDGAKKTCLGGETVRRPPWRKVSGTRSSTQTQTHHGGRPTITSPCTTRRRSNAHTHTHAKRESTSNGNGFPRASGRSEVGARRRRRRRFTRREWGVWTDVAETPARLSDEGSGHADRPGRRTDGSRVGPILFLPLYSRDVIFT